MKEKWGKGVDDDEERVTIWTMFRDWILKLVLFLSLSTFQSLLFLPCFFVNFASLLYVFNLSSSFFPFLPLPVNEKLILVPLSLPSLSLLPLSLSLSGTKTKERARERERERERCGKWRMMRVGEERTKWTRKEERRENEFFCFRLCSFFLFLQSVKMS